MSDIVLVKQMEQPTYAIRTVTKVESLPQLIGESYGKIVLALQEFGEMMTDVPFVCYHNLDMQNLDVEIGFPISRTLPIKDGIKPGVIPEGYSIFCMYRGPYGEIEPVYNDMAKWIEENGYEALGSAYEFYFNGPGFPESELLTKVVMPVKRKS
jgi:effector-binding domain-containing protein